MKRLLPFYLALLTVFAAWGQNSAIFPNGIVRDTELPIAKNFLSTTLSSGVSDSDTTLPLANIFGFVAPVMINVDGEIIRCRNVSASNLTNCTRGFDGTLPASHSLGVSVRVVIGAWQYNQLAAEIKALEASIAPTSAYAWSYSPAVSISAGVDTYLTVTPCPLGIPRFVKLSGGVGTTETPSVVAGGSCTAGAATGTIRFTPTYSHSGAYTIGSASAGLEENIVAKGPTGGHVQLGAGLITVEPGVTIRILSTYDNLTIEGVGAGTQIYKPGTTANVFELMGGAGDNLNYVTIKNLTVTTNPMTQTNGAYFYLQYTNMVHLDHLILYAPWNGIVGGLALTNFNTYITDTRIDLPRGTGCYGCGHWLRGLDIQNVPNTPGYYTAGARGIVMDKGDGFYLSDILIYGQFDVCLDLYPDDTAKYVRNGKISNLIVDTCKGTGIRIGSNAVNSSVDTIDFTNVHVANQYFESSPLAAYGILIQQGSHLSFTNPKVFLQMNRAMYIDGGLGVKDISITNGHFLSNGLSASGTLPAIEVTNAVDGFQFTGNRVGKFASVFGCIPCATTFMHSYSVTLSGTASQNINLVGNTFDQNSSGFALQLGTLPLSMATSGNHNLDNFTAAVASGTTITVPAAGVISLTGSTTVATINGGWPQRQVTFTKSDAGSVNLTGGNMASTYLLPQWGRLDCIYTSSKWYCK